MMKQRLLSEAVVSNFWTDGLSQTWIKMWRFWDFTTVSKESWEILLEIVGEVGALWKPCLFHCGSFENYGIIMTPFSHSCWESNKHCLSEQYDYCST